MADPAPYEDRLYTALRKSGIIAGPAQVDAITEAIREIIAEEIASLGGSLLGHFGPYPDPSVLTSAADPVKEAAHNALASLGGFLLEAYGRQGG